MRYKIDPLTGGLLPAQNDSTVSISSSTGGSGIVESIVAGANVIVDSTDPANPIVSATGGGGTTDHSALSNLDYASAGHTGFQPAGSYLTEETDPVFTASEAASFAAGDAAKLTGIEAGAEVNNISDVNATDLTDGGATTLHKHSYSNLDNLPSLVTTFTGLTDVPDSYTGQSGKVVAVKGTEDGVEFISAGGVGTVTSVAVSGSDGIQVDSGSPITTSGTIALGINKTTLLTHINVADGATAYTDEMAQDAVGNAVGNGLDYDDTTGAISVDETELTHNSIGSKQGGTTNEYYHLTSAEVSGLHAAATVADSTSIDMSITGQQISAAAIFGTDAGTVCQGNDARLSDARTPVAHNQAESTITFTNITTGNATTSAHGYVPIATAPASGLYNYVGITNGETAYTNKALFDATKPTDCILGNSAAVGTATVAARRDHQHAMPTLTTMYNLFYPVGCIYTTTVSTNPGTLFGIGTWEAFGEGKVLVGKASAGTFNTAGATGGSETVTLTSAQSGVPAHTHPTGGDNIGGTSSSLVNAGGGFYTTSGTIGPVTVSNNTAANAAEAHTNLQPYVVVYYWKRTA